MTKDPGEFQQTVACREYTLPRDDKASQPKGWIRGNMRIGLVLEVTTSFQHFKYGIEIRIESVNQDNSHSWVRISYGTVKYVNDSIKDDTENLADLQEEEDVPTSTSVVAAKSKAEAKPQPRELAGTTATIPIHQRRWIDIEPSEQNLASYDLSKKVINLLRHNQKLHREEDGAIQFYKIKFHLRDNHPQKQNWSDDRWIACLAAGGGSKRRYQYCSDYLGSIIYLRALQGHSGSNLIDPTLQRQCVDWTWNIPLHLPCGKQFQSSFNYQKWTGTWRSEFEQKTICVLLPVDPRKEDHKDPEYIDYSAPRLARYLQNARKRHQDTVFEIDIDLGIREGLMFYQTRSNAIILQGTLPAHRIVRAERLKNGEKLYENQYLSPRPPPKISLKHDLNWSKGNDQGSTVEHRPVGKFVQQSLEETLQSGSSKPTQFPKPIEDRTGQPVTQEIVGKLQEELSSSDRSGQPDREKEKRVLKNHDRSGQPDREERLHKVQEVGHLKNRDDADKFNLSMDDENIDFNISGIPDETVKRSQSISVHDLIQRIESHPQKEAIQNDLEQHQSFNPFSAESKVAIMAAGNTELCEIINVEPKWQCKICFKH